MQNAKRCGCSFQQQNSCYAGERIRVNANSECGRERCSVQDTRCPRPCTPKPCQCRPCAPRPCAPRGRCGQESRRNNRCCGNDPYGYGNYGWNGGYDCDFDDMYDDWDWDYDCGDDMRCSRNRRNRRHSCECEHEQSDCEAHEHHNDCE